MVVAALQHYASQRQVLIGMAENVEKVAKSVEILQGCVEQSTEHITPTPRTILLRIFYQKILRLYSERELPGGGW